MQNTDTKTQAKTETPKTAPRSGDVIISAERLPMPIGIQERFDVDRASWRALTDAIFPMAKTPAAIVLALAYCRARRLDIFKRVVHIVPMWNQELDRNVETVWPGIAEVRTTASRTGAYAGNDAVDFGDWEKKHFKAEMTTRKGKKIRAEVILEFPTSARMTVYRMVQGQRVAFVGPVVYFEEFFGYRNGLPVPNARWSRAPSQMLEKCAEAGALRRAFPEEFGDEPTAEEMEGRILRAGGAPIGPDPQEPKRPDFKADRGVPKDGVEFVDPGDDNDDLEDGVEVVDDVATSDSVVTKKAEPEKQQDPKTASKAQQERERQGSAQTADQPSPSDEPSQSAEPDSGPAPAESEVKSADEEFDEMVGTCIESVGGIDDVETLKAYQRRVRDNIANFAGVATAKRDRSRGRLNAAVIEREREISRGKAK